MKHIFVINPAAGPKSSEEFVKNQLEAIGALDISEIYVTKGPKDATNFVRTRCAESPDEQLRFYACGGDGTLCEVVAGVVGFDNAEMTCYPCGSGNDYVKYYGGKDVFLDLKSLINSEATPVDLMKVCGRYSINITLLKICAGAGILLAEELGAELFIDSIHIHIGKQFGIGKLCNIQAANDSADSGGAALVVQQDDLIVVCGGNTCQTGLVFAVNSFLQGRAGTAELDDDIGILGDHIFQIPLGILGLVLGIQIGKASTGNQLVSCGSVVRGLGSGGSTFHIYIQRSNTNQTIFQKRIVLVIQVNENLCLFLAAKQTAQLGDFVSSGICIAQFDKVTGDTGILQNCDLILGGIILITKHSICAGGDHSFHIHLIPLAAGGNIVAFSQGAVSTNDAVGLAKGIQDGTQAGNIDYTLVYNGFSALSSLSRGLRGFASGLDSFRGGSCFHSFTSAGSKAQQYCESQ